MTAASSSRAMQGTERVCPHAGTLGPDDCVICTPNAPKEKVHHHSHYHPGNHEVIDVIEAWGLDFSLGNAVKYIARHKLKGAPREDLEKARWYLDRAIENLERER